MKFSFTDHHGCLLDIEIEPHPEVLTPSTYARRFSEILISRDIFGKRILDLGSGSGILSVVSALRGAIVHAIDISPAAVGQTLTNAKTNGVEIESCEESDLFSIYEHNGRLVGERFDLIIANHPSLPGKSASDRVRTGYVEWNQNGSGRFILDAVLERGSEFLRDDGSILTHSSSGQDWTKTIRKLSEFWPYWQTLAIEELPIQGEYYEGVVDNWIESGGAYRKNGAEIFHELRIIEAAQSPLGIGEKSGDRLLNLEFLGKNADRQNTSETAGSSETVL